MIHREPFPLKNISLKILLIGSAVITVYIFFLSFVSVWVGLNHLNQDGFWIPIVAGTLAITAASWLFLRLLRSVLSQIKEKGIFDV